MVWFVYESLSSLAQQQEILAGNCIMNLQNEDQNSRDNIPEKLHDVQK